MGFFRNLVNRLSNRADIDWEEIEAVLISADLGLKLTSRVIDALQDLGRKISPEDVHQATRNEIVRILGEPEPLRRSPEPGLPTVFLISGVNGVGKTTSTAKLAFMLKNQGHRVILAAADTFRAAAIEQLQHWGERLDVPVVAGKYESDPAAVCYSAHDRAVREKYDFVLCDTAGRLHTRHNLMEELKKVRRSLAKLDETSPHERLLVVDATTGGNALAQARQFNAAMDLTGLIVTKLDGSGKGGCVVAIREELNLPTRFIGTGEKAEDFKIFDPHSFVADIL